MKYTIRPRQAIIFWLPWSLCRVRKWNHVISAIQVEWITFHLHCTRVSLHCMRTFFKIIRRSSDMDFLRLLCLWFLENYSQMVRLYKSLGHSITKVGLSHPIGRFASFAIRNYIVFLPWKERKHWISILAGYWAVQTGEWLRPRNVCFMHNKNRKVIVHCIKWNAAISSRSSASPFTRTRPPFDIWPTAVAISADEVNKLSGGKWKVGEKASRMVNLSTGAEIHARHIEDNKEYAHETIKMSALSSTD